MVYTYTYGQVAKIGYVNLTYIYGNMPAFKTLNTKLNQDSDKYSKVLEEKNTSYIGKLKRYQELTQSGANDAITKDLEIELTNLQKSLEEFQTNAQNDLQQIYQKEFTPIEAKVMTAIKEYGVIQNYNIIFRNNMDEALQESKPTVLYAADPNADISNEILKKLGVKIPETGQK